MSTFKRLLPMILMCVFEIIAGVLLLTQGEKFIRVIFIIFGVVMLVGGLITLIRSLLAGRNGNAIPGFALVVAIVLIAFGAFFTAASGVVLKVLTAMTLVMGFIMLINGIFKLIEFFAMRKEGALVWFLLIDSIVTILLGLILVFNPFSATVAIWVVAGVMSIVTAVIDLIAMIIFAITAKNTTVTATVEVKGKEIKK